MVAYLLSTPTELVSGGHNGFPGAARLTSGRIVIVWRAGSAHSGGTPGVIKQIHSDDDGATWSTPITVLSETGIDLRDPVLAVLADGRMSMTLFRYNGSPLGVNVAYSSDNGATWTMPALVPFSSTAWSASSGPLAEPTAGTLVAFSYGLDTSDTYTSIRYITSTDNGETWGGETLLLDGETDTTKYEEPFPGVLADGRLMVDVRQGYTGTTLWRRRLIRSLAGEWSTPTQLASGVRGRPAWLETTQGTVIVGDRIHGTGKGVVAYQQDETAALSAWENLIATGETQGAYQQFVELPGGLIGVAFCYEQSSTYARVMWATYTPDNYSPPTTTNRRRGASSVAFL